LNPRQKRPDFERPSANLQPGQRRILNAVFPLLAGFATFFIGGTALIKLTGLRGLKIAFTGTAGVAMFVFKVRITDAVTAKKVLGD
jgi:hypothetical protein